MYSTPNNKMQIDSVDMGDRTDSIIEEVKEILLSNGGEYLGDEELKMKICYKIRESVRKYLISNSYYIYRV